MIASSAYSSGAASVTSSLGLLLALLLLGAIDARVVAQMIAGTKLAAIEDFHPSRILIRPQTGADPGQLKELHRQTGAQVLRQFHQMDGIQVLQLGPGATVPQWIMLYEQSGLVDFAEPDYRLRLATAPNDPRYLDGSLWHLHNTGQSGGVADADIDAPEAWATLRQATNIIVAIVDTGVRYTHEDLAPNMWVNPGEIADGKDTDGNGYIDDIHGINAAANNGNPIDINGHGTQVAGLVGAVGNNAKGVTGVAWSVRLMALRFFDDAENGYVSDAVECFDYARANGAHIINASFGSPSYSSSFFSAINSCRNAGIIVVAAAGNDGLDTDTTPYYPACYNLDNIVALSATTRTDTLASYSNYGATSIDLAAPGSDLYTTYNSSDASYVRNSGTSFAAPVTAGAFALLKARYPADSHLQLIERVLSTVDPLPSLSGKTITGGRLNLASALGPSLQADFAVSAVSGELPLTVDFTDRSFGDIVSWKWDFGNGATSTLPSPSHTFNQSGDFVVSLSVTDGAGQTSEAIDTIQVVANYQVQPATFQWIDPTGMPTLSLTANGVSPAQSLPFTFHYYGQSYDAIHVSANGMVGFAPEGLNQASNVDLPNSALPNAMLCPWWDDLNPEGGGSVHVGVTGTAPDRRFVISWVGIPHRSPGKKSSFTFQAVMEEASRSIVFQYLNVDASHNLGAGKSATVGVENQSGTVAARYSYDGSTPLQNNQAIAFVPALATAMSVTPTTTFSMTGPGGGPFTPTSQDYTVSNPGTESFDWEVAATAEWLSLHPSSGTLAPGDSILVSVSLNAEANTLPAGSHGDTVSFINLSDGSGDTSRAVLLTVDPLPGVLTVSPAEDLTSSGTSGGPFSPDTQTYTLSNSGETAIDWMASKTVAWLSLSATTGSLAPGASIDVAVSLNAAAGELAVGSYGDTVSFANLTDGRGDTSRAVLLAVVPVPGVLTVSPAEGMTSSGTSGGPFSPHTQTYTLSNSGETAIDWTAGKTVDWLSLSATAGNLDPGASIDVAVSLNAAADELAVGSHGDTVSFTNLSDGHGDTSRAVLLTIEPAAGMLGLVTASAFQSSGFTGGPFEPDEAVYDLVNDGGSSIDWLATNVPDWLEVSPSSGTLAPGDQVSITLRIGTVAGDLPVGILEGSTTFMNSIDPTGSLDVPVQLEVFHRAWLVVEAVEGEPSTYLITVRGHPGHQYAIEVSEDWNQWTAIHTDTLDSTGKFEYLHARAPTIGFQLFRVAWNP
jgi:subtilisin family serine protease